MMPDPANNAVSDEGPSPHLIPFHAYSRPSQPAGVLLNVDATALRYSQGSRTPTARSRQIAHHGMKHHLHNVLRRASRSLRSSTMVTQWLFHATVKSRIHDDLWDATTIVLRTALRRYVRDGHRVLDLGTGHIGILAVYCASLREIKVTAVDINEHFIENARRVAVASDVPNIRFVQSNWFSAVSGEFDIILSNIPYVPTPQGESREDATTYREVWDGGSDGLTHARTILKDAATFLTASGRMLLGINAGYVPRSATVALVGATAGLELEDVVTSRWSPGEVYVIRRCV